MKEETPTVRLLKTISVTIVHSAFVVLKDYFEKKFPFSDIPSAWKISFLIGKGDGSANDKTAVTHTKAAKSKDISPEESFEFLWQLKLTFNYEMTELLQLSVQITALQTSSRFPSVKLRELQHLVKTFNELNHSRIVSKKQTKKVNPKREHEMRKKLRQKLRQIPSYDMISTTLRRDCSVLVKGRQSWSNTDWVSHRGKAFSFDEGQGRGTPRGSWQETKCKHLIKDYRKFGSECTKSVLRGGSRTY